MRETVLSGFEQRWALWAGAEVKTRFKIKGLCWWSREGLLGKLEDLWSRMAHWTSLLYSRRRGKRRSRGYVTLKVGFLGLQCPDRVKVREAIRKAHSQQMRAWVHQHGVGRSWRPCERGEWSSERGEKRKGGKNEMWHVLPMLFGVY